MDGPYWIVPYQRNPHFVGRATLLRNIHDRFNDAKLLVLEGLNGIGKTQVAIEYAFRLRETSIDTSIFWVQASDSEALTRDCNTIAKRLDLGLQQGLDDVMQLVKVSLERLSNPWLLIIDQADDVRDKRIIHSFLPYCEYGQILFTTSDRKVPGSFHHPIEVGPMSHTESRELLEKTLKDRFPAFLPERLEYIPLALLQAASFVQRESHEPADLDDDQLANLLREPVSSSEPVSAMAIWSSTFERILRSNPDSIDVLSVVTLLGGSNVPSHFVQGICGFSSKVKYVSAYGVLLRHKFMVEKGQSNHLTIRPLLKIASRHWLTETGRARQTLDRIINFASASNVDESLNILDPVALKSAIKPVLLQYGRQELLAFLSRQELPEFLRREIADLLRNPTRLHPPTVVVLRTGSHEVRVYEDVLCHWSPYFQALSRGPWVEATGHIREDGEYIKELNFDPDIITVRGLDALVYFVYHGNHAYNDLEPDVLDMEDYFAL